VGPFCIGEGKTAKYPLRPPLAQIKKKNNTSMPEKKKSKGLKTTAVN